jgi:hypothetical protein
MEKEENKDFEGDITMFSTKVSHIPTLTGPVISCHIKSCPLKI